MKPFIYVFLVAILIVGMIFFDYAFPNLSVQQSIAATLSIYCFSFFTGICIKIGLEDNNDKK